MTFCVEQKPLRAESNVSNVSIVYSLCANALVNRAHVYVFISKWTIYFAIQNKFHLNVYCTMPFRFSINMKPHGLYINCATQSNHRIKQQMIYILSCHKPRSQFKHSINACNFLVKLYLKERRKSMKKTYLIFTGSEDVLIKCSGYMSNEM